MSSLRLLPKSNLIVSNAFNSTLVLIPFTFPYPQLIFFNVPMVLLTILWLIKGDLTDRIKGTLKNPLALLFLSTYLIFVIGIIYSQDRATGVWILEKRLPLLIFPLILATETLSEKIFRNILLSFIGGCLLATLICIGNILYYDVFFQTTTSLSFESFDRERFSSFIPLHPPYFSLYITFCIVILGSFLIKNWIELTVTKKTMLIGLILYLLVVNLLLSSRMPLIFLALIFCVWLIRHIYNHPIAGSLVAAVILAIIVFLLNSYTLLQDRFREITETDWSPPEGNYHNSTNMRVGIFICTTSILKDHWLLGVGTGDTQEKLNYCYEANGYSDVLYKLEYNSHNEYFNIWLKTGIGGLALFVLSLFIPLNKAYKGKFYLYLAFLSLIILFCVTESLLERQKGIVFYGFFNSIFAFRFKEFSLAVK